MLSVGFLFRLRGPSVTRSHPGPLGGPSHARPPPYSHQGRRRRRPRRRPVRGVRQRPGVRHHRRPRRSRRRHARPRRRTPATTSYGSTCPAGFAYRSFHDTSTPVTLRDGTRLPGRHDGMGAFTGPDGSVLLVRNHEVNNPMPAFGPTKPYDKRGGCRHDDDPGDEVRRGPGRVHQPERHDDELQRRADAVGRWVTCEETVNGPDVGPDFTGRVQRAAAEAARLRLRGAGRRARGRPPDPQGRTLRPRGGVVRPRRGHRST